jgi:hypothetical protein
MPNTDNSDTEEYKQSHYFANNPQILKKNMQILLRQILKVKDCFYHQELDIHTAESWISSHQFWSYQTTSTT